ncbi:MAG TPA: BTAD domain-containing putative transcriptional regulator, partial [Micromonosporaceae bacterium]|nr:BTAD domain-containing putative transcriptional regulator [Micromonosporaceae bacterium]
MRFRVLGPLQVAGDGARWLPVRSVRQRSLLAMLLFGAGEFVPAERLVDSLWQGAPPRSHTSNLHTYVSRLRERIAPVPIESNGSGYRLCVSGGDVDLLVFRAEADSGRRAGDPRTAAAHLRRALDQWRDRPLADLSLPALEPDIARLEVERLALFEDLMTAELAAGRHAEVLGELRGAVVSQPLSE